MQTDHPLQREEPRHGVFARQSDEALQLRRDRQQRRDALAVLLARELQREREGKVRNERERVRRVQRQRRQDRKNLLAELCVQPSAIALGELFALHYHDAGCPQFAAQVRPQVLLIDDELARRLIDARKLLRRGQPIVARCRDPGADHALQAGHADHIELVQVGGGDGKKPQALQQRMPRILGFFQNAAVERQPG